MNHSQIFLVDQSIKDGIKSIMDHLEHFRVGNYSTMREDVIHAWKLFCITFLPKVSLKWHDEMKKIKAGNSTDTFGNLVTISDEAFVLHVVSWYLPQRETVSKSVDGVKQKPG